MEWLVIPLTILAFAFVVAAMMGNPIIKITINKNYKSDKNV